MSSQQPRHIRTNNIALFPASELSTKKHWQRIANTLPPNGVLICSSRDNARQQRICQQLSLLLERLATVFVTSPDWGVAANPESEEDDNDEPVPHSNESSRWSSTHTFHRTHLRRRVGLPGQPHSCSCLYFSNRCLGRGEIRRPVVLTGQPEANFRTQWSHWIHPRVILKLKFFVGWARSA